MAEHFLNKMELIYMELLNFDDLVVLLPGLRRKMDIARKLIEITRGDVTLEIRRNSLKKNIEQLKNSIEKIFIK